MRNRTVVLILALSGWLLSSTTWAEKVVTYTGEAKKKNQLIYTELHTVRYSDQGQLLSAKTEYFSPEKKPLAQMESDFTSSLTAPNYVMIYQDSGDKEGIRRQNQDLILFSHEKGKLEKTKTLSDPKSDRVLMGCQGFSYYILENLEALKSKKSLLVTLLFPGKLDSYNFKVSYLGEPTPNILEFELTIDSFWLKMFAPNLKVRYDAQLKRIAWYKGLSNLTDAQGKPQEVEIEYK